MRGYVDDSAVRGDYYSQDELQKLVHYAKEKYITIVPEIDIPGHVAAMLYVYPELAAYKVPDEVQTRWGIFPYVLNPHENTFVFLKKLIDEIDTVFDSSYIHLGGDEVLYNYYKKDKNTQNLIRQKVLKTYKDAPWYILEKMCAYICTKNRIPIVWDDAYKVAIKVPGTHVMIWQSMEEIQKIQKHNVPYICSSASHFYFDYYQKKDIASEPLAIGGYTPIEAVYTAPIEHLDSYCIGIQANMWTEYTKTPESVWYMIHPRIYALAECAWGRYTYSLDMFIVKLKQWKLL